MAAESSLDEPQERAAPRRWWFLSRVAPTLGDFWGSAPRQSGRAGWAQQPAAGSGGVAGARAVPTVVLAWWPCRWCWQCVPSIHLGILDRFHPGDIAGGLPVPRASANPCKSPLSCLPPPIPRHRAPRVGCRVPLPLQPPEAHPRPCSGVQSPHWGGGRAVPGSSAIIRSFRRRLTWVFWALLLRSRLGAVAISTGRGGCGELAES